MTLYDSDFYAWTQTQAKPLKVGIWGALDIENLVEREFDREYFLGKGADCPLLGGVGVG